MSFVFQQCPDGHRCGNGSQCVEVENDEGTYMCDCDAIADEEKVFAGLSCEHKATSYCNDENAISRNSFCTNGGSCTENVSDKQAHFACNCPEEYKGDHCEYTATAQLPDHALDSITGKSGSSGGLSSGAVAGIVLVVVGAVLAFGLYVIRKRLRQWEDSPVYDDGHKDNVRAAPELVLDADGSVLSDAMKSGAGVNSPAAGNGTGSLPENVPVTAESLVSPTSVSSDMENGFASPPPPSSEASPADPAAAAPTTPQAAAETSNTNPEAENGQVDDEGEPTEPEIV